MILVGARAGLCGAVLYRLSALDTSVVRRAMASQGSFLFTSAATARCSSAGRGGSVKCRGVNAGRSAWGTLDPIDLSVFWVARRADRMAPSVWWGALVSWSQKTCFGVVARTAAVLSPAPGLEPGRTPSEEPARPLAPNEEPAPPGTPRLLSLKDDGWD